MPELIEVEQYRSAVDPLVGERLTGVDLVDPQFVRPDGAGASLQAAVGDRLVAARRHGKLLILDFGNSEPEMTMGLRFGMTGRLLVDGKGPIDRLEFSSGRNDPAWDRVRLSFGTTVVAVRDPRRLGSIEAEPDEERLGVDALQISAPLLAGILRGRRAPLKATLLDQQLVAGLGNLLVDDVVYEDGPDRLYTAFAEFNVNTRQGVLFDAETTTLIGGRTGFGSDGSPTPGDCLRSLATEKCRRPPSGCEAARERRRPGLRFQR